MKVSIQRITPKSRMMWIIQNKCAGCSWEDESSYEPTEFKDMMADLKEYRESSASRQIEYRAIKRRVKYAEVPSEN